MGWTFSAINLAAAPPKNLRSALFVWGNSSSLSNCNPSINGEIAEESRRTVLPVDHSASISVN